MYCSILLFCIAIGSASQAPIQISPRSNGNTLYQVFIKYQNVQGFSFTPSDHFTYIPNLNEAFHVTKNTLFRVTFQGTLHMGNPAGHEFIQIMVNDYLIIGNKLLRNTDQRLTVGLGTDRMMPDGYGGFYYGGLSQHSIDTRIAMVYLPPGTYTFNVGVRARSTSGSVFAGIVTYELTQFADNNQDLGGFKVAIFS